MNWKSFFNHNCFWTQNIGDGADPNDWLQKARFHAAPEHCSNHCSELYSYSLPVQYDTTGYIYSSIGIEWALTV